MQGSAVQKLPGHIRQLGGVIGPKPQPKTLATSLCLIDTSLEGRSDLTRKHRLVQLFTKIPSGLHLRRIDPPNPASSMTDPQKKDLKVLIAKRPLVRLVSFTRGRVQHDNLETTRLVEPNGQIKIQIGSRLYRHLMARLA